MDIEKLTQWDCDLNWLAHISFLLDHHRSDTHAVSSKWGVRLVNCPTQPTCIAHCDLCIRQLYFITNPQWEIWKKYSTAISFKGLFTNSKAEICFPPKSLNMTLWKSLYKKRLIFPKPFLQDFWPRPSIKIKTMTIGTWKKVPKTIQASVYSVDSKPLHPSWHCPNRRGTFYRGFP